MNIMLFLTPKSSVEYIYNDFSVRQVLEKMEFHHYTAIPVISRDGKYVGTLTEGDLLWTLKDHYDMDLKMTEKIPVKEIVFHHDTQAIHSHERIEDLLSLAIKQNFVPVVDDKEVFIGIITRKTIIQHFINSTQHV